MCRSDVSSFGALIKGEILRIADLTQVGEDTERAQRQADWRERSAEHLRLSRQRRLRELRSRRAAVQRAQEAYQAIDRAQRPVIGIRDGFIRLAEPRPDPPEPDETGRQPMSARALLLQDLATRPPLTKLVHRKTNALTLLLTAIYVAHLETGPGEFFVNAHRNHTVYRGAKPWATLAGLHPDRPRDSRNRRVRITRALEDLRRVNLVEVGPEGKRGRFEEFSLNSEDGILKRYATPSTNLSSLVHLPASFFLNCWHIVLEPNEIAVLLAIIDLAQRTGARYRYGSRGPLIALPRSMRWRFYGISGEVYGLG
jgi:hypothetical protein